MKIAQILWNKIHWIPDTEESLEEFRSKFAPDMIFVEVSDDVQEGWNWNGQQATEPLEPQPTIEELKAAKLQQVDAWTRQHITGGFFSTAKGSRHKYDSEEADQLTFTALYVASKSPDFSIHPFYKGQIPIRCIPEGETEKNVLGHNAEEMQALVNNLAEHIGTCKTIGWQLQAACKVAGTAEDLTKVVWPE